MFLAFVADLAVFVGVGFAWGRRAAGTYLLLALPLLPMLYRRFDLVSVALVTWGAALFTRRGDDEVGSPGIVFGLAIWTKLWPVVLLPVLFLRRAQRSLIATGGLVLLGGLAWFFIELLPVSQIVTTIGVYPGAIPLADHFLYLALVPACILLVQAAGWLYATALERRLASGRVLRLAPAQTGKTCPGKPAVCPI